MKKIPLLSIFILMFGSLSQAQLQKGTKLLGGGFSFYASSYSQENQVAQHSGNAGLTPAFSILVGKNLALGARGFFNYYHDKSESGKRNSYGLGLGIFLRKYNFIKERFGIYFDNQLNGSYYVNHEDHSGLKSEYWGWGASYVFTPGIFYKFTNRIMGEGSIGGLGAGYNRTYSNEIHNSWIVSGTFLQTFNLGINFILNRSN